MLAKTSVWHPGQDHQIKMDALCGQCIYFLRMQRQTRVLHELPAWETKRKKGKPWKQATLHPHINQSWFELLAREFVQLITKIDFITVSNRIEFNIFNCAYERRLTVPPDVLWRDLSTITAADRFKYTGRRSFGLILSLWKNFLELIKDHCILSNYMQFLEYLFSDLSSRSFFVNTFKGH